MGRGGPQKLARRVLALAVLLPRPSSPAAGASATSFAWTRLGRSTMTLAALFIVLAALIIGNIALAGGTTAATAAINASATLPVTVLGGGSGSPGPQPSPSAPLSAPPSLLPSASATAPANPTASATSTGIALPPPSPSASHTQPNNPPPTTTPPSSPPPPPPSSPPPAPTPKFPSLSVQGRLTGGPVRSLRATSSRSASTRATGSGDATLHIAYLPVTGSRVKKVSVSWNIPFTVTKSGPITWPYSAEYQSAVKTACDGYNSVNIEASILVNGETVASTETSEPVLCYVIT